MPFYVHHFLAASDVVLEVIAKRIAIESPNLPIFTIHDNIVTIKGNEDYVRAVIQEDLEKAIGIPAECKCEYWKPENIEFDDGTPFLKDA